MPWELTAEDLDIAIQIAFLKLLEPRHLDVWGIEIPKKFSLIRKSVLRAKKISTTKGIGSGYSPMRKTNRGCNYKIDKQKRDAYVKELKIEYPESGKEAYTFIELFMARIMKLEADIVPVNQKNAPKYLEMAELLLKGLPKNWRKEFLDIIVTEYSGGLRQYLSVEKILAFANKHFIGNRVLDDNWMDFTNRLPSLWVWGKVRNGENGPASVAKYLGTLAASGESFPTEEKIIDELAALPEFCKKEDPKGGVQANIETLTYYINRSAARSYFRRTGIYAIEPTERERELLVQVLKLDIGTADKCYYGFKRPIGAKSIKINLPSMHKVKQGIVELSSLTTKDIKFGRLKGFVDFNNLQREAQQWILAQQKHMPCSCEELLARVEEHKVEVWALKSSMDYEEYTILKDGESWSLSMGEGLYRNFVEKVAGNRRVLRTLWDNVFGGHFSVDGCFAHVRFTNVRVQMADTTLEKGILIEEMQADSLKDRIDYFQESAKKAYREVLNRWDYLVAQAAVQIGIEDFDVKHALITPEYVQAARWGEVKFMPKTYESLPRKMEFNKVELVFTTKTDNTTTRKRKSTVGNKLNDFYTLTTKTTKECKGIFWYMLLKEGGEIWQGTKEPPAEEEDPATVDDEETDEEVEDEEAEDEEAEDMEAEDELTPAVPLANLDEEEF